MKKIKIAEPCHENWNDFTPTQRGAFCGKCQINVIDFSTKSNQEIKTVLLENAGKKMCGRFSKVQLNDFNSDYHIWQNQNQSTFQSKFIFALVLTFGLTLFSCTNESQSLALNQLNSFLTPTTQITSNFIETDTTKQDSTVIINNTQQTTCNTLIDYSEDEMIMGDMPMQPIEQQMTKGEVEVIEQDTTSIIDIPTMAPPMMLGMIAYHEEDIEIPVEIKDTVKSIINNETENVVISLTDKFEANLFPNPTKNNANLTVNVLAKETYAIGIYDIQGQLIKNLYEGIIEPQIKTFRIDLNSQKNGIYFIKIITETQNESLKLVKSN